MNVKIGYSSFFKILQQMNNVFLRYQFINIFTIEIDSNVLTFAYIFGNICTATF